MTTLATEFLGLQPAKRRAVHFKLCEYALIQWQQFANIQGQIHYVETVVGTHQEVDKHLPADAFDSANQGIDLKDIQQRYLEPISALQDDDLEFPDHIEFAYYAIYNLFRKYAQDEMVDDWLIVNQAIASEPDNEKWHALLAKALLEINLVT
jgi:hypothetical protein